MFQKTCGHSQPTVDEWRWTCDLPGPEERHLPICPLEKELIIMDIGIGKENVPTTFEGAKNADKNNTEIEGDGTVGDVEGTGQGQAVLASGNKIVTNAAFVQFDGELGLEKVADGQKNKEIPEIIQKTVDQSCSTTTMTSSTNSLNVQIQTNQIKRKAPDDDPHPFHAFRRLPAECKSSDFRKKFKSTKKELKRLNEPKKTKKSLSSFLGDKDKYNIEEMVRDVQLGLKNSENEGNLCSLRSVIERPAILGNHLVPLQHGQLSGFRLHHSTLLQVAGTSTYAKDNDEGLFKVPAVPPLRNKEVVKVPVVSSSTKKKKVKKSKSKSRRHRKHK